MPLAAVIVLVNACAGLCVSAVLKYCDSLVKGFSTSVSVLLAMCASALLFGFTLTRPFAIGSAVVCCSFYLYFGDFNAKLVLEPAAEKSEKVGLLSASASAPDPTQANESADGAPTTLPNPPQRG